MLGSLTQANQSSRVSFTAYAAYLGKADFSARSQPLELSHSRGSEELGEALRPARARQEHGLAQRPSQTVRLPDPEVGGGQAAEQQLGQIGDRPTDPLGGGLPQLSLRSNVSRGQACAEEVGEAAQPGGELVHLCEVHLHPLVRAQHRETGKPLRWRLLGVSWWV
jgi:hypothetical protein